MNIKIVHHSNKIRGFSSDFIIEEINRKPNFMLSMFTGDLPTITDIKLVNKMDLYCSYVISLIKLDECDGAPLNINL